MKISVIVPVYNRSASLAEAITSILEQSHPADEVIIVDDGSQEDLSPVLAPFGARLSVHRQANGGAAAARNTGVRLSSGTWLTFLDSDDIWMPDRLEILHRDLVRAPEQVIAHLGDVRYVGPGHDETLFTIKGRVFPSDTAAELETPLDLVISGMTLQGAAIRRDAWDRIGGLDTRMPMLEDTAFFCQLALTGNFLVTQPVLAEIRRLAQDGIALTSLERTDPLQARQLHAHYLRALLPCPLTHPQRDMVNRLLSGAEFHVAEALAGTDPGAARKMLMQSARHHPSALKGWGKASAGILFGQPGFSWLRRNHTTLDRS